MQLRTFCYLVPSALLVVRTFGWHLRTSHTALSNSWDPVPCNITNESTLCNVSFSRPPANVDELVTSFPPTYVPVGGPPEQQVNLWPPDKMPGKHIGYFQGPERFVLTGLAPPDDKRLRVFCSPNNVGTYGHYSLSVSTPTLAPFLAPGNSAVVIVPGGGGLHVTWEVAGTSIAQWFQGMGISAFVLKYRVPVDDWEETSYIMDVQRALSFVRTKYMKNTVGIFGDSFGGRIAVWASTAKRRKYRSIDDVDQGQYRPDFTMLLYPADIMEFLLNARRAPPTFTAVSRNDPCVNPAESIAYHNMIPSANRNELHIYSRGMHGWGTCEYYQFLQDQEECQWPAKSQDFLRRVGALVT